LLTTPSINVIDAFNKGGAGVSNNSQSRTVEVADNFDFSIGRKHAMRVGALLEGGRYENFDAQNAAGTFTFGDLASYNAGRPLQFTQRRGEVTTSFNQYEFGLYWQDDIRVNKNLSISLGVRQEMQSPRRRQAELMPRFGATWNAPGKVVIRGGYGTFYDWYDTALYDQTAARQRHRAARSADPQSRLPQSARGRRTDRTALWPRAGGAPTSRCPTSIRHRWARSARSRRTCSSRRRIRCCAGAT
jgi:hypothetical protein